VKVEVVGAWPRGFDSRVVELPPGATVADAVAASGLDSSGIVAHAVFGLRVEPGAPLRDGDRVELLRPLLADPKDARRRRAAARKP
jgi:hypothetical protein